MAAEGYWANSYYASGYWGSGYWGMGGVAPPVIAAVAPTTGAFKRREYVLDRETLELIRDYLKLKVTMLK